MSFLAIDFETADYGRDSACAIGLVRVQNGRIVRRDAYLIRPPRSAFVFSYLHGITWEDVRNAPHFAELWPRLIPHFEDVDFLVAHNAGFDRGVLYACCAAAGIRVPDIPFQCTMVLSRRLWNIYPTTLPDVCRHFDIPLHHHDAASDTEACAEIMIRAIRHMNRKRGRRAVEGTGSGGSV